MPKLVPPPPPQEETTQITQAAPTNARAPDNPDFFRYLCYLEFAIVCLVGLGVLILGGYLICWVVWQWKPDIHARIVETVKGINTGWKVALGILIPLFFRPVAKFLIYLKKAQGWETVEPAQGGQPSIQEYAGGDASKEK